MGSSDVKKRKLFDDPSFALVSEVATPPTLPLKASEYDRACFAKVWCILGV